MGEVHTCDLRKPLLSFSSDLIQVSRIFGSKVFLHDRQLLLDDLTAGEGGFATILPFGLLHELFPLSIGVEDVEGKEFGEVFVGIGAGIVTDEACVVRALSRTPPVGEGVLLLILERGEFVELWWVGSLLMERMG